MRMCVDQDLPYLACIGNLSRETGVAFARLCPCGIETAVAFAGEKCAFVVQFVGAEAMPVSLVPCWGRAEASSISTSPYFCVLCAKFFAPTDPAPVLDAARRSPHRQRWGFCTTRSLPGVCRRRVGASCSAIPPVWWREAGTSGGVVPKVQTTSVKDAENGLSWARWSTF